METLNVRGWIVMCHSKGHRYPSRPLTLTINNQFDRPLLMLGDGVTIFVRRADAEKMIETTKDFSLTHSYKWHEMYEYTLMAVHAEAEVIETCPHCDGTGEITTYV
jgi:hypothetical protein